MSSGLSLSVDVSGEGAFWERNVSGFVPYLAIDWYYRRSPPQRWFWRSLVVSIESWLSHWLWDAHYAGDQKKQVYEQCFGWPLCPGENEDWLLDTRVESPA